MKSLADGFVFGLLQEAPMMMSSGRRRWLRVLKSFSRHRFTNSGAL